MKKSFLFLVILFAFFQASFGQENPKAVLYDQMPASGCDEFLARTTGFLYELQKHPNSRGYAVISGKADETRRKVLYELLIKGVPPHIKYDGSRVTSVRSADTENFRIQFWIVPAGAEKPDFKEAAWNFVFPPGTKPFIFVDDNPFICPEISFELGYVEFLNANPEARGHVVIYEKSLREFNRRKRETLRLLKEISPKRLRFFHVRKEMSNNIATAEYWLVPRKKK